MSLLDIIIVLVLAMSAIIGFKRGAIKEIVSLVGIIIVFVVAFSLKGVIGNVLCKWLPFFNFAGNFEGVTVLNILLYQLLAFLIIYSLLFSVYMIVLKISGVVQKCYIVASFKINWSGCGTYYRLCYGICCVTCFVNSS